MPTDETTLEALERLANHWHCAALAHDGYARLARQEVPATRERVKWQETQAAEARLIADALRFRIAALTAPAAQDTAEVLALLDGADGSGCGPDDTFTLYLPLHRARRLHALVTARIAHDEEARSAAALPRGGADV